MLGDMYIYSLTNKSINSALFIEIHGDSEVNYSPREIFYTLLTPQRLTTIGVYQDIIRSLELYPDLTWW